MVHKLGYGAWDELKAEIRRSWRFRFDWFFKSRMPQVPLLDCLPCCLLLACRPAVVYPAHLPLLAWQHVRLCSSWP